MDYLHYLSNVHVWKVREKIVADKEPHQHPVIDDPLKVKTKRELVLGQWDACW